MIDRIQQQEGKQANGTCVKMAVLFGQMLSAEICKINK